MRRWWGSPGGLSIAPVESVLEYEVRGSEARTEVFMVSAKVAEWESEPLAAEAVMVKAPAAAELVAPRIRESLAPAANVKDSPRFERTPGGSPLRAIETVEWKP